MRRLPKRGQDQTEILENFWLILLTSVGKYIQKQGSLGELDGWNVHHLEIICENKTNYGNHTLLGKLTGGQSYFFQLFLKLFEILVSKDVLYFSHYSQEILWPQGIPLGR